MSCSVISLNVCSIASANRLKLLHDFIKQTNANIYLLQETKTDNLVKIRIPGYNVLRGDHKRGQWGNAIIIDNNLQIRNLRIARANIQAITIDVKLTDNWFTIASCYFPHNLNNCRDTFSDFFAQNRNTFFGGDTNSRHINFGDISSNVYGNALKTLADTTDLKIFNPNAPTCFRSTDGSYIDKFLSNSTLIPSNITVIPSFSDHSAIKCTLPINITQLQSAKRQDFSTSQTCPD